MFQHILVPLDGSPRAEQALPLAAQVARALDGSVLLLQVICPPIDYGGGLAQAPLLSEQVIENEQAVASRYLDRVANARELAGIATTTDIVFGLPAQDILAEAQSQAVDLIVMCSHGRSGFMRWALGSVAQKVARHSPVPVLVLRADEPVPFGSPAKRPRPISVLVTLDGSPLAETALAPAAHLVAALTAPAQGLLHLMQVVKVFPTAAEEGFVSQLNQDSLKRAEAYLAAVKEQAQETFEDLKLSISWSVALDADVADAIIGTAEYGKKVKGAEGLGNSDLIAMSTHGRGGLEHWMIGSVTERVLGATRLPMLIVRPQKEA